MEHRKTSPDRGSSKCKGPEKEGTGCTGGTRKPPGAGPE